MNPFNIRQNLPQVALALLLATPVTAAPRLMGRGCLSNIVADLSCADSPIMSRCIAIETVDTELLATCLEAAGCTEDEAENALWITEKCQTGSISGDDSEADKEGELRRRSLHGRNRLNMVARADSTSTSTDETSSTSATATSTSSSSTSSATSTSSSTSSSETSSSTATSTSTTSTSSTSTTSSSTSTATLASNSSADFNVGLSSAIVGVTLGIAASAAFLGVFVCCWREGASKRKAKRAADQKEALLGNMS
ncbi:hypothetical protein Daus18300_002320 [Diaporthe australafricana]|uniref:Extracellular membrane protein CFEM domain-containing protein n=1 Tax=Diaporthe australafricana TaxID=127596 RepID=A0ABR3XPQ9_9PEZI